MSALAFHAWGTGAPRIVLIHGFCDGGFVWNAYTSLLRARFAGITVDLRGHGDSPWDASRRYERAALAEDVALLLDDLGLKNVMLIGHSLGAEVAIRVAAEQPARTRGLVIVDGGPDLEDRAAMIVRQQMSVLPWRYDSVEHFAAFLAERHPLADASALDDYASCALRRLADGKLELKTDPVLRSGLLPPDTGALWAALDRITCPKLLVRGATSALLSQRKAAHVSQRVRDCRLVTVPRAGHSVALDNPHGLHAATQPFLEETVMPLRMFREAQSSQPA